MRCLPTPMLVLILAVAGCLEGGDTPPTGDAPAIDEPVERIDQGQHSGIEGPVERVIGTQTAWEEFWEAHKEGTDGAEEPPQIDFSESRVVAVVLEDKPNACYGVEIQDVTTQAGETVVRYTVFTPAPGAVCAMVETQPFDIVKIPARATQVVFESETREAPTQGASDDAEPAEEPVERIEQGQQSGVESEAFPVERVITTQDEWEAFWRAHREGGGAEAEEPPAVDFSEHRVVAVVLGDRPNACYAVRIDEATTQADKTVVEYTEITPPPDAFCAEVITQPFDIVKIPARDTSVVFEPSEEQADSPE